MSTTTKKTNGTDKWKKLEETIMRTQMDSFCTWKRRRAKETNLLGIA